MLFSHFSIPGTSEKVTVKSFSFYSLKSLLSHYFLDCARHTKSYRLPFLFINFEMALSFTGQIYGHGITSVVKRHSNKTVAGSNSDWTGLDPDPR